MKKQMWVVWLLIALALSSCANNSLAAAPAPTTEERSVQDKDSLVAFLQTAGATVEEGDPLSQPFFTPEGRILRVNGADVQVFEYESAELMEEEASHVTPDGGSVGLSTVTWIDIPHFYKAGRIIVLYVGTNEEILNLLSTALGPQFAGG